MEVRGRILLPYAKRQIPVEIADQNLTRLRKTWVEASLGHPIEGSRLDDLVRGNKKIVIISSDHTRPVPSRIITSILLRRIRAAQPDVDIKTPRSTCCFRLRRMASSPAVIWLCRHCKTAWNVEGRLQDTIDLPLSQSRRCAGEGESRSDSQSRPAAHWVQHCPSSSRNSSTIWGISGVAD